MRISRKVLFDLPPVGKNTRNSEGDFIRIPDGRIMFAYTRYCGDTWYDHENSTICAIYSDDGEHFDTENIHTLIRPEQFGGTNAMSVTLIPNGSGGISMYFIVKFDTKDITKKPVRDEIYRVDSSDGYEFSGETVLCFPKRHEGYYCINNSRVEVLKNGRIIIPMSEHKMLFDQNKGKYFFDEEGHARFVYSDDCGKTWNEDVQVLSMPDASDKHGLQEPGMIELDDGRLYGYFRTGKDYQYESFSSDNGNTWSEVRPSRFESPLSPMEISRNPYSGKYYAIWNPYKDDPNSVEHPRFRNTWGRTPLAIAESEDGINYSDFVLVEEDIHRGYCYPAIYFLNEKEALMSYCSGGGDIVPLQRTTVSKITLE